MPVDTIVTSHVMWRDRKEMQQLNCTVLQAGFISNRICSRILHVLVATRQQRMSTRQQIDNNTELHSIASFSTMVPSNPHALSNGAHHWIEETKPVPLDTPSGKGSQVMFDRKTACTISIKIKIHILSEISSRCFYFAMR